MSDILKIAISGLSTAQSMIATTAHNIANVETAGYSRQVTNLTSNGSQLMGNHYFGQGVTVESNNRIVDQTLINNSRESFTTLQYWQTQQTYSQNLNNLLGNPETSLNTSFDSFFNAVNQLSTQAPGVDQSNILMQQVMSQTQNLTTNINNVQGQFNLLHGDLAFDLNTAVADLNNHLASIATLNLQIKNAQMGAQGGQSNDLCDMRDQQLRELAGLAEIGVLERDDFTVDVYLTNGQTLVTGSYANSFATQKKDNYPSNVQIVEVGVLGYNVVVDNFFVGGKIGAILDFQKNTLNNAEAEVNKLVIDFSLAMNAQHKLGMDSQGFIGQNIFTDFNQLPFQLERSISDSGNLGNAIFQVAINPTQRPQTSPYVVTSTATALIPTATMVRLGQAQLSLNGFTIQIPVADAVSPAADAAASAIALANAINASVPNSGVTATANFNVVNLGTFTVGSLAAAGNFVINGTNIASTGVSAAVVVEDINSQTYLNGVRAELDVNNNIILIADDGRNIQIDANGTAVGSFAYFNTLVVNSQVARASITITGSGTSLVVAGNAPAAVGLNAVTIPPINTALTTSDYTLTYSGISYSLVRDSDNVQVYNGVSPNISVDGFTINLAVGAMVAKDSFTIRPTINAAYSMALLVPTVNQLAFATPVKISNAITNSGQAKLTLGQILNTSGMPAPTALKYGNGFFQANNSLKPQLSPPLKITFFNDDTGEPTLYRIYDMSGATPVQIGPIRQYNRAVTNQIFPLTSLQDANFAPYTWDPGFRVSLAGTPVAGDSFTIGLNDGRSNYLNATEIVKMQQESIIGTSGSQTTSFQAFYANITAHIGINNQQCNVSIDKATSILKSADDRLQSFSGVNMDDECANLLRFQQYYSAAAQLIKAQNSIFAELMHALRG